MSSWTIDPDRLKARVILEGYTLKEASLMSHHCSQWLSRVLGECRISDEGIETLEDIGISRRYYVLKQIKRKNHGGRRMKDKVRVPVDREKLRKALWRRGTTMTQACVDNFYSRGWLSNMVTRGYLNSTAMEILKTYGITAKEIMP